MRHLGNPDHVHEENLYQDGGNDMTKTICAHNEGKAGGILMVRKYQYQGEETMKAMHVFPHNVLILQQLRNEVDLFYI